MSYSDTILLISLSSFHSSFTLSFPRPNIAIDMNIITSATADSAPSLIIRLRLTVENGTLPRNAQNTYRIIIPITININDILLYPRKYTPSAGSAVSGTL